MKLKNICTNCQLVTSENGRFTVFSYETPVLSFDYNGQNMHRLWDGYSVTTMKHINKALDSVVFVKLTKKEWDSMPVEEA